MKKLKTFRVFDANGSLLANHIFEANTHIEAARMYLRKHPKYLGRDLKRSADNDVPVSVREVIFENGQMFFSSKPTQFYKLIYK